MRKHKGNWKLILASTLLGLYLLFFLHLYAGEVSLPSENWSRQIQLAEITDVSFDQISSKGSVFSLPSATKGFDSFYVNRGRLYYVSIDAAGMERAANSWPIEAAEADDLTVFRDSDGFVIHLLENRVLYEIRLQADEDLLSTERLSDEVLVFALDEQNLLYATESGLTCWRTSEKTEVLLQDAYLTALDACRAPEQPELTHLSFIKKTPEGKLFLHHGIFNENSGELSEDFSQRLPSGNTLTLRSFDSFVSENTLSVLYSQRDYKSGSPVTHLYTYSLEEKAPVSDSILNLPGMEPAPVIDNYFNGRLEFIASVETRKGLNRFSDNLCLYAYENGVLIQTQTLTKTNATSIQPFLLHIGDKNWLQWTDLSGDAKTLYFSGDSPELIKRSAALLPDEWIRLFMDSLTGLVPILFLSLFPLLNTFAIVVVPIALFSFFKLSIMERHSKRITFYAILSHVALKLLFTFNTIASSPDISNQLPFFLKTDLLLYACVLAGTFIAYYCMKLKTAGETDHFWGNYTFFALVDILIYSLLIMPYYYTYLLLPYFFN